MKNTIDIRENILELITKTMNEYDYRDPSEEYASHEMLLLISRIKELPAAEEVEFVRWRTTIETSVGIDEEFHTSLEGAEEYLESMAGRYPTKTEKVAIRRLEDKM
jgi:hypothetical protein